MTCHHLPVPLYAPGEGSNGSGKYRPVLVCATCREELGSDHLPAALDAMRSRGLSESMVRRIRFEFGGGE